MAATIAVLAGAASADASAAKTRTISVIVREAPGSGDAPERAVRALGGTVGRQFRVIAGFEATIPVATRARLAKTAGVAGVTVNVALRPHAVLPGTSYDQKTQPSSMWQVVERTGAWRYWGAGITGKGVDVAVIDTGVAKVPGLDAPGKLKQVDLSFEATNPNRRHLDGFGHGTHLAGIVAGNDLPGAPGTRYESDSGGLFLGMAPDAGIVSVRVGDSNGVADVSQVIAAIDWVVAHRNDPGNNIRVLLLAYGTDSTQDYAVDPLAHAVEAAWKKNLMVVVAGGNGGIDTSANGPGLVSPAKDPFVVAVGALDPVGTTAGSDDRVASFSSTASGVSGSRGPDLVAHGVSILSLLAPGSYSQQIAPSSSFVGTRFMKGSGTSQASAVVAGALALIAQRHPNITPNQAKAFLTANTSAVTGGTTATAGAGKLNLTKTYSATINVNASQGHVASTGTGSLDSSRGSRRPTIEGVALTGEVDIFGRPFDSAGRAQASMGETAWSGGDWNGSTWTGSTWTGSTWTGSTWTGSTWTGSTWSGSTWSGSTWSGSSWLGSTWSTTSWS